MKRIDRKISIILICCLCISMLSGCSSEVMVPYASMTDSSSFRLLNDNAGKAEAVAQD